MVFSRLSRARLDSDDEEERTLVDAARTDPAALSELYRIHYPPIARFVQRRIGNQAEAEDIVSEVFLAMVKGLSKFQWRGVPFRIWLYRIATNLICRWARKRRHAAVVELKVDIASRSIEPTRSLDMDDVDLVLSTLPIRLQEVLSLRYLQEMKLSEIALVIKRPEGTVKSRIHEGRKLMRERLQRLEQRSSRCESNRDGVARGDAPRLDAI